MNLCIFGYSPLQSSSHPTKYIYPIFFSTAKSHHPLSPLEVTTCLSLWCSNPPKNLFGLGNRKKVLHRGGDLVNEEGGLLWRLNFVSKTHSGFVTPCHMMEEPSSPLPNPLSYKTHTTFRRFKTSSLEAQTRTLNCNYP